MMSRLLLIIPLKTLHILNHVQILLSQIKSHVILTIVILLLIAKNKTVTVILNGRRKVVLKHDDM